MFSQVPDTLSSETVCLFVTKMTFNGIAEPKLILNSQAIDTHRIPISLESSSYLLFSIHLKI